MKNSYLMGFAGVAIVSIIAVFIISVLIMGAFGAIFSTSSEVIGK